jgi:hypothetical protein
MMTMGLFPPPPDRRKHRPSAHRGHIWLRLRSAVGWGSDILRGKQDSDARGDAERTSAITTQLDRHRQGDLLVGLANLVESNRLALVVLAANVAGAGSRARDAAIESAAARWLARNARAVRLFLLSLSLPRLCGGRAGYRAIEAVRRPIRRRRAPRLLRHRLDQRAAVRVDRALGMVRERPRFVVSLC